MTINKKRTIFTFGKYKGKAIKQINDLNYLEFVLEILDIGHEVTYDFSINIEDRIFELIEGEENG